MNVLIILGGNSSERDISLLSGKNIGESLSILHSVTYYDLAKSTPSLAEATKNIDVAFPVLHGKEGEDGQIQKQLEDLDVPYVGSSSKVSAICFDKWLTILKLPDVLFPTTEIVTFNNISQSQLIKNPFVIKPKKEGSSIDTFIVNNPADFDLNSLQEVFVRHNGELMIEEFIKGTELTVGIVEDIVLPVVEIIPPEGKDFDYENKYNGQTQENCPPLSINNDIQENAQNIAMQIHKTLGCRDYSRTDFIATEDGKLYALEINTIPGMTKQSLLPKAAYASGMTMEQLADKLVNLAFLRNN